MLIKIRNPKNFCAGLFFTAFGLAGAWIARGYPIGTAVRMGAGYFPIMLGGVLAVLGLVITGKSLVGPTETSPRLLWRPLLLISVSVVLFGLLIRPLGLVLTTVLLVLVSGFAGVSFRWRESLALGALLALLSAALFVYGLGLLFPLWPGLGG